MKFEKGSDASGSTVMTLRIGLRALGEASKSAYSVQQGGRCGRKGNPINQSENAQQTDAKRPKAERKAPFDFPNFNGSGCAVECTAQAPFQM